jgi:hypothetical protein
MLMEDAKRVAEKPYYKPTPHDQNQSMCKKYSRRRMWRKPVLLS